MFTYSSILSILIVVIQIRGRFPMSYPLPDLDLDHKIRFFTGELSPPDLPDPVLRGRAILKLLGLLLFRPKNGDWNDLRRENLINIRRLPRAKGRPGRGVSYDPSRKKWMAWKRNPETRKLKNLGRFRSEKEAMDFLSSIQ